MSLSSSLIEKFRKAHHDNKGSKWWMLDIATWSAVRLLYLIEYADFDAQEILGYGLRASTGYVNSNGRKSGKTDVLGDGTRNRYPNIQSVYHTLNIDSTSEQPHYGICNQYRWIENPMSVGGQAIDGIARTFDGTIYVSLNNEQFMQFVDGKNVEDAKNVINTGTKLPGIDYAIAATNTWDGWSEGYDFPGWENQMYVNGGLITGFAFIPEAPWLFIPDRVEMSNANGGVIYTNSGESNYVTDTIWDDTTSYERWYTPHVGTDIERTGVKANMGYNHSTSKADGMFSMIFYSNNGETGSRLIFIP